MTVSRLDQLYRRLLLTKFFTRGWGKPDNLKRLFAFRKILSNRDTCQHLVPADYPINVDKEYRDGDCVILEGHFTSPLVHHLPGIMPKEVETASFQMILPLRWRHSTLKPVCIHLAGTGDHYFWRRRFLTARPLLKEAGIASILLENPYYGTRKPKHQLRSSLHNVSDLFVMGGALVLESLALLHWCEREGWGPLGLSGISMGGHMASLAATNWHKPISLIPCLSWSTASCVFTQGVMSGAIPWKTLQEQFFENSVYQDEIRKQIISPEDKRKAYNMGQDFVKDYSHDLVQVESIHQQVQEKQPQVVTPHEKSASSGVGFVTAEMQQKSTAQSFSDSLSPSSSNNSDRSILNSQVSDTGEVKLPLTCQEYIERVSSPQSFSKSQTGTVLSQGVSPSENILSAFSLGNNFTSSISAASQQQHPLAVPGSSNVQQHSSSSSLVSHLALSSVSSTDKYTQGADTVVKDSTYQNVKTASVTYSGVQSLAETHSLTLKNAISKSRLMIQHPPSSSSSSSSLANEERVKDLQQEALDFMRGVMDECTHLGNFSVPVDPELIIIVSARQDAYVPKDGVIGLDQLWPGCEVRYVDQGHVGAVLFNQSVFRKAIADAFDRQVKKYYQNPSSEPCMKHSLESVST